MSPKLVGGNHLKTACKIEGSSMLFSLLNLTGIKYHCPFWATIFYCYHFFFYNFWAQSIVREVYVIRPITLLVMVPTCTYSRPWNTMLITGIRSYTCSRNQLCSVYLRGHLKKAASNEPLSRVLIWAVFGTVSA